MQHSIPCLLRLLVLPCVRLPLLLWLKASLEDATLQPMVWCCVGCLRACTHLCELCHLCLGQGVRTMLLTIELRSSLLYICGSILRQWMVHLLKLLRALVYLGLGLL